MILRSVEKLSLWLFLVSSAWAHPYDDPFAFRKHLTNDGRVIYSNIEKRCFSNGLLTCQEYHPIWKGRLKASSTAQVINNDGQSKPASVVAGSE